MEISQRKLVYWKPVNGKQVPGDPICRKSGHYAKTEEQKRNIKTTTMTKKYSVDQWMISIHGVEYGT